MRKFWAWLRRFPCRINVHDWREGPFKCAVPRCEAKDEIGIAIFKQVIREGVRDGFKDWQEMIQRVEAKMQRKNGV
jgi:hypothetical protein